MTIEGETTGKGTCTCETCGKELINHVCCSAAGYYIGKHCDCGPYSRESGYYRSMTEASIALIANNYGR